MKSQGDAHEAQSHQDGQSKALPPSGKHLDRASKAYKTNRIQQASAASKNRTGGASNARDVVFSGVFGSILHVYTGDPQSFCLFLLRVCARSWQ